MGNKPGFENTKKYFFCNDVLLTKALVKSKS